ncbi:MAG: hypothetical protein RIC19_08330 [Phaeodactylibacter sp.]|uniref:hypothetical protein n=1 Tax=Phaeodactylibacter sp. TaxID=1940289 RepID=UPI0032EAF51E
MFGDLFNGLILGNSDGLTLADGTQVPKQTVERLQTTELGYRGQLVPDKLFIDANAYYNISEDFLSPLVPGADLPGPAYYRRCPERRYLQLRPTWWICDR